MEKEYLRDDIILAAIITNRTMFHKREYRGTLDRYISDLSILKSKGYETNLDKEKIKDYINSLLEKKAAIMENDIVIIIENAAELEKILEAGEKKYGKDYMEQLFNSLPGININAWGKSVHLPPLMLFTEKDKEIIKKIPMKREYRPKIFF